MKRIPPKLQPWFEARRRFKLSHAHIQMARELGMNPKKFGSLANENQEPWKGHRNFVHPRVSKPITISGAPGDDAKHYQVRAAKRAVEEPTS